MTRNNLTLLPTKHHLNELPERFSNFFCNKVQTIKDHVDKHLPVPLISINFQKGYHEAIVEKDITGPRGFEELLTSFQSFFYVTST